MWWLHPDSACDFNNNTTVQYVEPEQQQSGHKVIKPLLNKSRYSANHFPEIKSLITPQRSRFQHSIANKCCGLSSFTFAPNKPQLFSLCSTNPFISPSCCFYSASFQIQAYYAHTQTPKMNITLQIGWYWSETGPINPQRVYCRISTGSRRPAQKKHTNRQTGIWLLHWLSGIAH